MRLKLITSALISASMIGAVPAAAVAQTSSASKLSIANVRTGAAAGESRLAGGSGGIIALALVAGIAAIAIVGAIEGDNNDSPNSP